MDSSAAALLLKKEGFHVAGATLLLCPDASEEGKEVADARAVCQHIGIDHYTIDMRRQFQDNVIAPFCQEYLRSRTPNPCIVCNRTIKFGAMLDWALEQGFDGIATGHYVRKEKINDEAALMRSSSSKDQSYVLWQLNQHQLEHSLFPLADLEKEDIRALIKEADLPVFSKKDSQDICFIPDGDYAEFITKHYQYETIKTHLTHGSFISKDGKVLGQHNGLLHYTVGQRKGLGGGFSQPMFVLKLLPERNEIMIGTNEQCFSKTVFCSSVNIINKEDMRNNFTCAAKLRYAAPPVQAQVTLDGDHAVIALESPHRAVTPGQSAVFYDGDRVIGGAVIDRAE